MSGSAGVSNITNHICLLASLKNIPFLVVNNFENSICSYIGFKALVTAFTYNVDDECFKYLWDTVADIFKRYCTPNTKWEKQFDKPDDQKIASNQVRGQENCMEAIHLTRVSNTTRVFVPVQHGDANMISKSNLEDFIIINSDNKSKIINVKHKSDLPACSVKSVEKIRYVPLKIKRITGKKKH